MINFGPFGHLNLSRSGAEVLLVGGLGLLTPFLIKKLRDTLRKDTPSTSTSSSSTIIPEKLTTGKEQDNWNNAIFFPCPCPLQSDSTLQELLSYLNNADLIIKICIMTLTFRPVLDTLIKKQQNGIMVQIITSSGSAKAIDKQIKKKKQIVKNGDIEVRYKKSTYSTEMHNKFVIVDDKIILTGSLNWTEISIVHQRENVLITKHPRIVSKFVNQFEEMWDALPKNYDYYHQVD